MSTEKDKLLEAVKRQKEWQAAMKAAAEEAKKKAAGGTPVPPAA